MIWGTPRTTLEEYYKDMLIAYYNKKTERELKLTLYFMRNQIIELDQLAEQLKKQKATQDRINRALQLRQDFIWRRDIIKSILA